VGKKRGAYSTFLVRERPEGKGHALFKPEEKGPPSPREVELTSGFKKGRSLDQRRSYFLHLHFGEIQAQQGKL